MVTIVNTHFKPVTGLLGLAGYHLLHQCLFLSLQTEALQQLQKDSEGIRSQYAHYFDLSLVNNGVDETLKKLQEAFDQACSSPQWVPVSWVY